MRAKTLARNETCSDNAALYKLRYIIRLVVIIMIRVKYTTFFRVYWYDNI